MEMDIPWQRVIASRSIVGVEFGGDAGVWPDTFGDVSVVIRLGVHRSGDKLRCRVLCLCLGRNLLT